MAAQQQTMTAAGRTWFGTLTLSAEAQDEMLRRAQAKSGDPLAEWWWEPKCDARFSAVRAEILTEIQKFWKRLRKEGHSFTYFLVFERHKSGLPHMHFLLHEQGAPILKRNIQSQWPWGFSNCSVVGGRSRRSAAPEKAAWYVVKYLSKSAQARQLASRGYRPEVRPNRR